LPKSRPRRSESLPAAALLRAVVEESGQLLALKAACPPAQFERRRQNLEELAQWFEAVRGGAGELAAQLALLSHADRDEPGNAVRLMSLHAAKGLEFGFVFVVGVEEGNLPHEASIEEGRLDEERRLMYVGITRAKQQLTLSHARWRQRYGDRFRVVPSRFIDELPRAEVHRVGHDPEQDAQRKVEVASAHLAHIAALLGD
jgi:ATP-dependent DNA helicase Rep